MRGHETVVSKVGLNDEVREIDPFQWLQRSSTWRTKLKNFDIMRIAT